MELRGFDVSDVDVTNFPELDCVKEAPRFSSGVGAGCLAWANHSSAGVAGWRYSYPDGNALYIQVKSAPVDEKALEALKGQLVPPRLKANYEAGKLKLVIIRVKYDFEELWHWSVILDRFAVSAGNTVGIASAEIGGNHGGYQKPVVWPLEDLKKVSLSETSEIRETIVVWALDPQVAAAAMPELLPARPGDHRRPPRGGRPERGPDGRRPRDVQCANRRPVDEESGALQADVVRGADSP